MSLVTPSATFSDLAVEIQTMIASYMSPYDLARFSQTCRLSRAISTRPNLYAEALTRMRFPPDIPTPAMSLPTFCLVFFGGGKCTACGKYTDALPLSYTTRLRVCGGPCKDDLIKRKFVAEIPVVKKPTPQQLLLDRVKPWMPSLETPIGRGAPRTYYLRSDLVRATSRLQEAIRLDKFQGRRKNGESIREREATLLKAWNKNASNLPGIMKTAQDVLQWQRKVYSYERGLLDKRTSKRLVKILQMRGLNMAPAEILRSPTLRQTIKFWHRDLQELSLYAFFTIQPIVLREAFLAKAGVPPPLFEYHKDDRILCPVCNDKKAFLVESLVTHIHHKHPEDFARVRDTYNTTPRFKYCELCPLSMKKFDGGGLKKHLLAKHTDTRD
ncbi:hypothetical protein DFH06DRAFT_528733 [Mycena polygramma]|nr:hypothetical protein DFH06DRAFT_528733 [Mycena polygramma]